MSLYLSRYRENTINLCYNGDIMTTKRKRIFDEGLSRQKRALRIPTTGAGEDLRDKTRYTRKQKHQEKIDASRTEGQT